MLRKGISGPLAQPPGPEAGDRVSHAEKNEGNRDGVLRHMVKVLKGKGQEATPAGPALLRAAASSGFQALHEILLELLLNHTFHHLLGRTPSFLVGQDTR